MPEADLQDLVVEMLAFQPFTDSDYIARYISAKSGHKITTAEVNVALERFAQLGYVRVSRTPETYGHGTLDVVALAFSAETRRPAM